GEALDVLADGGDHTGSLQPHRDLQGPLRAEGALAALGVRRVDPGSTHLDPDLVGTGLGHPALDELLALRAAVGGEGEDCGHACWILSVRRCSEPNLVATP